MLLLANFSKIGLMVDPIVVSTIIDAVRTSEMVQIVLLNFLHSVEVPSNKVDHKVFISIDEMLGKEVVSADLVVQEVVQEDVVDDLHSGSFMPVY